MTPPRRRVPPPLGTKGRPLVSVYGCLFRLPLAGCVYISGSTFVGFLFACITPGATHKPGRGAGTDECVGFRPILLTWNSTGLDPVHTEQLHPMCGVCVMAPKTSAGVNGALCQKKNKGQLNRPFLTALRRHSSPSRDLNLQPCSWLSLLSFWNNLHLQ